ncbi:hypothetical protein ACIOEZ_34245 [Streptomyces sp. NPDC087866]|uniref:hypothetical protein n=1 Tax=Streptomyces sp. NPDC087866 TaxID=3365815 RepID=UPI0037F5A67C
MQTPRILGREPSAILGLVAVAVQFFSAFVMDVSQDTQTLVNAVAATAVGLVVAWMVHDGVIAAITGLASAALALGMNLGLDWSTDKQAAWMAGVMFGAHWFVRTQVTAPVSASAPKAALPR